MSPQRCGGSDQVLNGSTSCQEEENKENRTLQYEEEFVKYKPGVGWLGFMVSVFHQHGFMHWSQIQHIFTIFSRRFSSEDFDDRILKCGT